MLVSNITATILVHTQRGFAHLPVVSLGLIPAGETLGSKDMNFNPPDMDCQTDLRKSLTVSKFVLMTHSLGRIL